MRSIIIVIFIGIYIIITLPILIICFAVGLFSKTKQYEISKTLVTGLTKGIMFLTGSKITITGLQNIPDETVLFVGNHRSIFDIVLLINTLNRPFGFIGKKEVTKVPYLNLLMIAIGSLPIDREDPRKALKTILAGIELLKAGHPLVIFPEGTRNKISEKPLPFKQGSLKLAQKANVPVIPFSIQGTDDIFENNDHLSIKKSNVKLNFGEPIILSELSEENRKKSASYIREITIGLLNS
jgi:1-acyl-sn-glycerol-3-phosphate acyltransferase